MLIGQIVPWPGIALPASGDWLWCDGGLYAQGLYPDLFAVLGATFGAAPPGFFFVPDSRIRMTVGAGTAVALAANDGAGLGARDTWQHLHTAAGLSGNSANLNVAHALSDSGAPSGTVSVDTGGAAILAGPDHVHTAPAIGDHTLGAHQHTAGSTLALTPWPPHQFTWRIIRWRI